MILTRLIPAVVFVAIFVAHALYVGACAASAPSGWMDFGISAHVVGPLGLGAYWRGQDYFGSVQNVLQKKGAGHGKRLEVTKQPTMKRTTTRNKITPRLREIKELMSGEEDFLRPLVGLVVQEVLEAEMSEALGAQKGERTEGRVGYRSGYYVRSLVTRVGKLELRVPQDRQGRFCTQLFERYQTVRRRPLR